MAFTAEAIARLKLDTTDFQRGLTKSTADVGKVGEDINRKLKRAFGAGDFFKGILQGIGIGSVQGLMEKLTKPWSDAADQAKSIEESTERTLSIYERIWARRRTDDQNLAENQKQQARLRKEIEDTRQKSEMRTIGTPGGMPVTVRTITRKDDAAKRAQLTEKLAQLADEEDQLRTKIKATVEKTGDEVKKSTDAELKASRELADYIEETQREQLSLSLQLVDMDDRMAALKEKLVESDTEDLELNKQIAQLERERLKLQGKLTEEVADERKEREAIAKKQQDAKADVARATADLATASRDRSGWTVGELAGAGRGSGVSQTTRARAKEISRLENQAKRSRAGGFEVSAETSQGKADALRKQMGQLTSSERDPMAMARENLKQLQEIKANTDNLKPTTIK